MLGEEDIAVGMGEGGVEFSTSLMINEIQEIQDQFHCPIEDVFFYMGKKDTAFEWGIPFLKDQELSRYSPSSANKSQSTVLFGRN